MLQIYELFFQIQKYFLTVYVCTAERIRTPNLNVRSVLLIHLSYSGIL